jgi:hypothetical protein
MKSEVYQRKVDMRGELLAGILDAVTRIKKGGDQLRRKTLNLRTQVAKGIEVGIGIS